MTKVNFTLLGEMPSKKNAWKRGSNGQVFIPAAMQKEIDSFLWQIKGVKDRPREPLAGPLRVWFEFYVQDIKRLDLDNMATTALDILQKSRMIVNDKDVVQLVATKEESNESKVIVTVLQK